MDESLQDILDQGFESLVHFLRQHHLMDDALFIDSTKILADANKYSFVWKTNTIRYQQANQEQLQQLLLEMKAAYPSLQIPEGSNQLEEVMTQVETRLEDLAAEVETTKTVSLNPAKQERRTLKSKLGKLNQRILKKKVYQNQLELLGSRNSYSKTDIDATFMRMKDDPMRNGQTKPGYNLQIATNHQFILAYNIFPNPSDTRTLQPFFQSNRFLIDSMKTVCLDAGYGSESNYTYLEDQHLNLEYLIPYGTMLKETSKGWETDEKKVQNWYYYDKDDYYIDRKFQLEVSHLS
ncbi:transposase [Eremococcus coleocola]|uniref:transposase n=1 Tax=Eremococcus coleocola TaxID=88132 RepID=UPI0004206CFF|nr:transposase [Eremococcus coleocola]